MEEVSEFVTSRKAAQILGVSLTTVQHWVESGILRAWKTAGGHRRIARNSVEKILIQQRVAVDEAADEHDLRVVVVEDDPVQLEVYELKFQEWGLPVKLVMTTNGFDGLLEVGHGQTGLVISDLDMPEMDGFAMIRAIVENKSLKGTKIVVVTGLDDNEISDRGGLPEGIPVLKKPVDFEQIKMKLEQSIGLAAK